jgi:hypothetical protein
MGYERMLDKTHQPTEAEILETIGPTAAWLDLRQYIETRYGDWAPELKFYAKQYGWTIRYRKSGKTLCSLFPELGAFSVLIVLGKKEVEKALAMADEFGANTRVILEGTEQLHDGRWLWIRVLNVDDAEDIKRLLRAKRKPQEQEAR